MSTPKPPPPPDPTDPYAPGSPLYEPPVNPYHDEEAYETVAGVTIRDKDGNIVPVEGLNPDADEARDTALRDALADAVVLETRVATGSALAPPPG